MAVCRTNAENIKIEPTYVTWEQQHLTTVAAAAASGLNNKYFTISTPTAGFYVWFNVNSGGTDPSVSGRTGIEVELATDDTAAEVATAMATAIDAVSGFNSVVSVCNSTLVYIQAAIAGAVTASADAGATSMTITNVRTGARLDVGFIDGDIELGLTENLIDVTAHQTGGQIIGALRSGRNIDNISIAMKESDAAKMKQIIEASGVEYTPDGGTAVSAWGSEDAKAFSNILSDCRKLVLHPISKADNNYTEDMCFWRAYPLLTGLMISGENPRMMNVEFKIMPDGILEKEARVFVKGDHTQNFLEA